jgi:hypothetical protein
MWCHFVIVADVCSLSLGFSKVALTSCLLIGAYAPRISITQFRKVAALYMVARKHRLTAFLFWGFEVLDRFGSLANPFTRLAKSPGQVVNLFGIPEHEQHHGVFLPKFIGSPNVMPIHH